MQLETYENLTTSLIEEIEKFLLNSNSKFNPLFSSPLWAERLKENIDFKYRYFIIKEKSEIKALHLVFDGYRGYAKINKLPNLLKSIAKFYARIFYGYTNWQNFIVFSKDLEKSKLTKAKELIYVNLQNSRLLKSPIYEEDENYFKNKVTSSWGTYILDIGGKSHEEVYAKFKKQARRAIERTKEKEVYVELLSLDKLDKYAQWLKENQKETGKSYKVDIELMKKEFDVFNRKNYIYEIFIALQDNNILGSLGIWGYGDFISEFGVNQSRYAKENKLYIQDVIKDSIVRYMLDKNIRYYDLAGFNPSKNSNSKEKAIRQFKAKFRGQEIVYKLVGDKN